MILVQRFDVHHGFRGRAAVVDERVVIGLVTRCVPVLTGVERQPLLVVKPLLRSAPSRGVERYEVVAVDAADAPRHGAYDGALAVVVGIAVAAEDPDDVAVAISFGYETAVLLGVALVEYGVGVVPLVAPRGEQADVHARLADLVDDVIHMVPIVVRPALARVGTRRVAVDQWAVSVSVRGVEPVQFGQRDGLNHGVTLRGAVGDVEVGFVAVETVEQLPCRISQPEERPAVGVLQITSVIRDAERPSAFGGSGVRRHCADEEQRQ